MNLIVDIGNSRIKLGVFKDNELIESFVFADMLVCDAELVLRKYRDVKDCIIGATANIPNDLLEYFSNTFPNLIVLSGNTKLPFANLYQTKETQGPDRIAAVAGAMSMFPSSDVLVIDAGTAITYDFINKQGEYQGGAIAPGMTMRFKALNSFTQKLPLIAAGEKAELHGQTTEESIKSGVQNGLIFEIQGFIEKHRLEHPDLKVVLSGGDAIFLAERINCIIFVEQNIVLIGLNSILNYNAQ